MKFKTTSQSVHFWINTRKPTPIKRLKHFRLKNWKPAVNKLKFSFAGQNETPATDHTQLKILIVSTWKTGNTWLKHLLAAIYDLPIRFSPDIFDPQTLDALGPRWVIHQHYRPQPDLLDWAKQNNVILITTYRHPADVLVSLCHHIKNYPTDFSNSELITDAHKEAIGAIGLKNDQLAATEEFVRHYFYRDLAVSTGWLDTGISHPVRYEALLQNPLVFLTTLTSKIQPVKKEKIEKAIEQCSLGMLREVTKRERFFRNGRAGDWSQILPASIIQLFKTVEPYSEVFQKLGYSLDPAEAEFIAFSAPSASLSPFKINSRFDNSVLVAPIINRVYLSLDAELTGKWKNPHSVAKPSFYQWLNQPAREDPYRKEQEPLITNLEAYIYNTRKDYQESYPDVYCKSRILFSFRFINHIYNEYKLDYAFVEPVRKSLILWSNQPFKDDPYRGQEDLPLLSNLAVSAYRNRPDIHTAFPDIYGKDRGSFLFWLLEHVNSTDSTEQIYFTSLQESFRHWGNLPVTGRLNQNKDLLPITNLALCIYKFRTDCQAAFPDLYGQDRVSFLEWIIMHGREDFKISWDFVSDIRNNLG